MKDDGWKMKDEGLNLDVHIKNEGEGWRIKSWCTYKELKDEGLNLDVHIKNEGWRMKSWCTYKEWKMKG